VLNLYVEYDARMLARLAGSAAAPNCDTVILRHGDASDVLASRHGGNPLRDAWLLDLDTPGRRVLAWSGTLADDLFASDPRTWRRPGQQAFARFCQDLRPQLLQHGRTLCFHPHARHVLNDVPSNLSFLNQLGEGGPFEVALSPASLLEPVMLNDVEDHLQRQFEALGARCAMVLLSDVVVEEDEAGEQWCRPVPLGQGALPQATIMRLMRDFVPPATPIVIAGNALAQQLEWLGCQSARAGVSSTP
jgi:hypothetical protein